tara:strand:+ start:16573 stop:18540 length:1968 start_codon:yes stop_codon:yes gene_type:complete
MKKLTVLLTLFLTFNNYAQNQISQDIGQTSLEELKMRVYKKDSFAKALVLFEQSNFYLNSERKNKFTTDYYYRIKILNKEGLEKGTFSFGHYKQTKLTDIKAITYNTNENDSIIISELKPDEILINKVNDDYEEIILALPNVKVGSVVEIKYGVKSAFPNIDDWYFQTDIPKVRSEIRTSIPRSVEYIISLKGLLDLSDTKFDKGKKCFPNKRKGRICDYSLYAMDSIPKFEEEMLMPDPYNLIPSLTFRVSKYAPKGYVPYKMMNFWFQFDKAYYSYLFKNDKSKKKFFTKIVPDSIKKGKDKLEIAKNIYSFVQNHYTWNGFRGGDSRFKFKKKFKKKDGSLDLINTTLYNSLKSAGINAFYVVLSTRGNGLPEKRFPIIENFNYSIIKVIINEKEYFLDASNKKLSFGNVLPSSLNREARILDYEKGGYWQKITPLNISTKISVLNLSFDEDMNLKGKMMLRKKGVDSYLTRDIYKTLGEEKYLEQIEEDLKNIYLDKFEIRNLEDLNKDIIEISEIQIENEDLNTEIDSDNIIRFSPVFFDRLSINPFKSNKRLYSLDFIYLRDYVYRLTLKVPDNYTIKSLPKSLGLKLPNDGGIYVYKASQINNKINIYIKFNLKKEFYTAEEYFYLKKLYEDIIKTESSFIELKKTNP